MLEVVRLLPLSLPPIKQITNPFTGKKENSVDRGLWRINNATFYGYQQSHGGHSQKPRTSQEEATHRRHISK